jgi:hypothetical protein
MLEDTEITVKRRIYVEEAILILLLVLSLVGVRITDFSPVDGYGYWMIMVFVFALFAIIIAWLQSKHRITDFKKILREQSIHWFTSLLMVEGVFSLQKSDHLSQADAGLVIMMILAQSTILDGLRVGWRFSLVGIFLGVSAIIAAHTQHFFWIGLIIAIFIVIGTILVEFWLEKRARA